MPIAELIGLILIGYGIWFGTRGVTMYLQADKSWWRHPSRRERYPYPAAGLLLSLVFVLSGLVFLLNRIWLYAPFFGYGAGGMFVLVIVIGVSQPRSLHPHWYGKLVDRLGRKAVDGLKAAAYQMPIEEWRQVIASDQTFENWVSKSAPAPVRHHSRGYQKAGQE